MKLKKIILIVLIATVSWGYYTKNGAVSFTPPPIENKEPISSTNNQHNYQCDGRQHCSQMSSYEEAKYFIENCPNTKMDGDNDGIPCERQFGRY